MRVGFFTIGGAPARRLPYFIERSRRRAVWPPEAAGLDDGCWFGRRLLVLATEAFINRAAPAAFLICQSSAVRPTPSGAEGAYSRTPVPIDLRFRPCL